jgi:GTP-binding protein EngB required for normal cell division
MRMLARSCPFNIRQLLWSSPRVTRLFSAAPSTVSIASQICQGCGCKLQPGDPASSGFVPSAVVAKIGSSCICKRCFRIKNYGARYQSPKIVDVLTSSNSKAFDGAGAVSTFLSSLRQAGVPVRVLLIVDPLDFSRGMWNQALGSAQALTSVPVDVCITKMDLLPHSADTQKIMESIAETIASDCEISQFTVSSNTQSGIKQVVQHVHQVLSKGISVMLVGFANAGKSSLANVLAGKLRRMVMPYDPQIASAALDAADAKPAVAEAIEFTVSKLPGTTMGIIPATLPGFQASSSLATVQLYDSPGMISDLTYVSLGARFCKNDLLANSICMSKRKKLRSLSVQNGQFIVIGRLCAIKVLLTLYGQQG